MTVANKAATRVGFLGLGRMGLPMARNILKAGFELAVCSGQEDAVGELTAMGALRASSARELAQSCAIVASCRISPDQSREVFLGPDGVLASGRSGFVGVDFATVDPMTSREIAAELTAAGIGFLDAPVSGGPPGAAAATLSVMAGGSRADFEKARPVLEAVGSNVFHMGDVGTGVTAKLCNNAITGTLHVLISEAMVLGGKSGIAPERLYEVLSQSTARSVTLERIGPRHILPRNFEPGSALDMIVKDLDCAIAAARAQDINLRLPALARECFAEASARGLGARDLSAVFLSLEQDAGIAPPNDERPRMRS
jgi:3-hydroxyisobutyrate dehydrogenase-like beta-hydroxyacid dehydrogenase